MTNKRRKAKDMKDDPREIDWAEKKIKALERRMDRFASTLDEMGERILAMTPYTELEFRVSALEGHPRRKPFGGVVAELPKGMSFEPPIASARTEMPPHTQLHKMTPWERQLPETEPLELKDPVERFIDEGPFVAGGVIPEWLKTSAAMNAIREELMNYRGLQ